MKFRFLFVLILTVVFPFIHLSQAYAEDVVCNGAAVIDISGNDERRTNKLQCVLGNYFLEPESLARRCNVGIRETILRGEDGQQYYCLNFGENSFSLMQPLNIGLGNENDVRIRGLHLTKYGSFNSTEPLLTIANTGMFSSKVVVSNSAIDCVNRSNTGASIVASNTIVQSTEISNCAEGIKIAASNVFLGAVDADHLTDMNDVHDNGVGIRVVSGMGNRWPYNLVRRNGIENSEDVVNSGILINAGANGDIARPAVVADMETGAILRCQTDQSGAILKRELTFVVPHAGSVSLYLSDRRIYEQANEYVGRCDVDETGVCVLENTLLSFRQNTCGLSDTFITALFTSDNSSMLLADSVNLGRTSTILMPTGEGPVDVPGASDDSESENGIGLDGLYVESAETGGTSGGGSSGGTGGNSGGNLSSAIASKMGCSFSAEKGSSFKRILEMWWVILILFFPKLVLNRRDS